MSRPYCRICGQTILDFSVTGQVPHQARLRAQPCGHEIIALDDVPMDLLKVTARRWETEHQQQLDQVDARLNSSGSP